MYQHDVRQGEGVFSYPGGRQDVGTWRGEKLIRLKFALRELEFTLGPGKSRLNRLPTPDLASRGNYGRKGYLEVRELTPPPLFSTEDFWLDSDHFYSRTELQFTRIRITHA